MQWLLTTADLQKKEGMFQRDWRVGLTATSPLTSQADRTNGSVLAEQTCSDLKAGVPGVNAEFDR